MGDGGQLTYSTTASSHQQHELVNMLATAFPGGGSSENGSAVAVDEVARVTALTSVRHMILQPYASLHLRRSSFRTLHSLQRLLFDKSYAVRKAAVVAYGAWGAVAAAITTSSKMRASPMLPGGPSEQFIGWALPQLATANLDFDGAVLSLTGLKEFLNVGEPGALQIFAPPILRACQSLLEDEGTSIALLRPLLGVIVVLSCRFSWCVQPHFADIVDLLLGWALESEVSELDCRIITDSFVQFQNLWVGNLSFSMNLLAKFLGDMEVLAQDATPTTHQQIRRLLALNFCFVAVLQALTSGGLEADKVELISVPTVEMLPRLISCLATVSRKFGDFNWTVVTCQCITLLAEFLKEKFANYYSSVLEVLFQNLFPASTSRTSEESDIVGLVSFSSGVALRAQHVHTLLQVNLKLLSVQGHALPVSTVRKLLKWNSLLSSLRLHPSRLVTTIVATTYMFLLQHCSDEVASEANECLREELNSLKSFLSERPTEDCEQMQTIIGKRISDEAATALVKFDLTALVGRLCWKTADTTRPVVEKRPSPQAVQQLMRALELTRFITDKLLPYKDPFKSYPSLQHAIVQSLHRLYFVTLSTMVSSTPPNDLDLETGRTTFPSEHSRVIVQSLELCASLPLILGVFNWISHICEAVSFKREQSGSMGVKGTCCPRSNLDYTLQTKRMAGLCTTFLSPVLSKSSHKEPIVRGRVAILLELLSQAELVPPVQLEIVALFAFEQLGDPEPQLQEAFRNVLVACAPAALWMYGWMRCDPNARSRACWKEMYQRQHLVRHLRPQQLVTILNYISQRWQSLPPSWLQRLVHNCPVNVRSCVASEGVPLPKPECSLGDSGMDCKADDRVIDDDLLEEACGIDNLSAGWWAVQIGAEHFVSVRLRTHLGGPTQTFAVLERMLVDAVLLFQADSRSRESVSTVSSTGVQLLPMRLLLEFMESLEKNIYNAYEGSVAMCNAPAASAPFFRANRKVCEEWFARIRDALWNLSSTIQCHISTFHHASLRLLDLCSSVSRESTRSHLSDSQALLKSKVQEDVFCVLRHTSLALSRAHKADVLSGLQVWTVATFGTSLGEDGNPLQKVIGPLSWMTGLGFQARGQYEMAVAHYRQLLLSEETLSVMGADGVQFTIARTIESYVALSDWEALDSWLQDLQILRSKHAGKAYSGALTTSGNDMNAIHALARFDAGDAAGAWGYLDLTPQSSNELTADPRQALQRSEQMLLQAMLRSRNSEDSTLDVATAKAMLEGCLLATSLDSLTDAAPLVTQLECIRAFEAGCACLRGEVDPSKLKLSNSLHISALPQVTRNPLDTLQQDCHLWLKLFRVYCSVIPDSAVALQLQQQLIRIARKQFNFRLARRLLLQTPGDQTCKHGMMSEKLLARCFKYESIQLNYAEENYMDSIVELWEFSRGLIYDTSLSESNALDNGLNARACLKLASWLKSRPLQVSPANLLRKMNLDKQGGHSFDANVTTDKDSVAFNTDRFANSKSTTILREIVGAAMKAATVLCPEMPKAWFLYASWCYNRARRLLMESSTLKPPIMCQPLELELDGSVESLNRETIVTTVKDAISSLVFSKCQDEQAGGYSISMHGTKVDRKIGIDLDALIQRLVLVMENAAGMVGFEDSNGESPAMLLATQLHQELQILSFLSGDFHIADLVNQLMSVWWDLRRKKVSWFGHAVQAFLYYLSISNNEQPNLQFNWNCRPDKVRLTKADGVLSASLFVLRILLNYGVELEDVLVQGLSSVPPSSWQALTAQLFARLSSHPEVKVRKQLEALLMSLAPVSPWAIVYPTLVNINACEGPPSEELHRILSCLVILHPRVVQDVQVMIAELGAITVLWDEQWLSTLQDLHADVMRRIATLKEETERVAENTTLRQAEKLRINAAKYSAIMAPIAIALERRLASTSRPAVTPHEVWFQEQFGAQLKTAISSFKTPPAGLATLGDAWITLDRIAASFGNHKIKPSTLLSDVSPQLAALRSSQAPMPGLEVQTPGLQSLVQDVRSDVGITKETSGGYMGMVTIAVFDDQVVLLATKTKPKKISMMGSDGERYEYLLKGREDLRLDARIMQLLRAVNGMMSARSTTRQRRLSVRLYSVTPISGQAGLIQWLNNLTSMYSVFKAWQQRVQAVQRCSSGAVDKDNIADVPRPSDLFYGKIIPALKEKGLRKVISRRDWPQEVKRKVLLELMKETPRELLYRELWCASAVMHTFNRKQERFIGSVAVMSMVGYILGLGDRHLDNILVDFFSGDVVHIDYNVCFDKGLRLKIPEIVPFRLTQTIQATLGLTGVEGMFRANCEAVLNALQNQKDLILMLLEVFIWDPLVEWMRVDGHDEATIGGEERKGMELAVSLSLFASRMQEIRVPLQEHHDQLLTTLPAVSQALQSWVEAGDRFERASVAFRQLKITRSVILKSETAARALVSEASTALEHSRMGHEMHVHDFEQVKRQLADAALEMTQWVERHIPVLNALRNGNVKEIEYIGESPSFLKGLSLVAAVTSAGLPLSSVPELALIHCKEVDREVVQLVNARHEALLHASQMLQAYGMALRVFLPNNYISSCDGHNWAQIFQALLRNLSPDVLARTRHQAGNLVARERGEHDDVIRQKYEAIQTHVEQLWKDIRKTQAECTALEASIDMEVERKAKERISSIFSCYVDCRGRSQQEDYLMTKVVSQSKIEGRLGLDTGVPIEAEDKRAMASLSVLHAAVSTVLREIWESLGARISDGGLFLFGKESDLETSRSCLPEFQKLIEQWVLLSDLITEFHQPVSSSSSTDALMHVAEWARSCRACIAGVEDLGNQLTRLVLPEALKAALSHDPAVLEAFSSLSRARLSVDAAAEQVAVIEAQRSSLSDLEKSYPEKVAQISKRLSELEENSAEGREHLSWEEADELANEEEACRVVLEELHRAWAQRGSQALAISRSEVNCEAAVGAAEQQFAAIAVLDPGGDLHLMRGKVLLAAFSRLFSRLEQMDLFLSSLKSDLGEWGDESGSQIECLSAGYSSFKSVWAVSNLNFNKMFFVWKVRIMDTLLNLCIQEASLSEDASTGSDLILSHKKARLEAQLHNFLDQYLTERLGPIILYCLSRQEQVLRSVVTHGKDSMQQIKNEEEAVKKATRLIHEYSLSHETVRTTNSAVSCLKSRIENLMQALHKCHMEAAQMEWLHDAALARTVAQKELLGLPNSLSGESIGATMEWWSRQKVIEGLQSSVAAITRASEALQAYEEACLSAEDRLDRAMDWACARSSSNNALSSTSNCNGGIPPEFHEHLRRRRQLLWSGQEHSAGISRLCAVVLEFEASRGVWNRAFQKDIPPSSSGNECHPWQKSYQTLISRLEAAFLSFTGSELEWQDAQEKSEGAAAHLSNSIEELRLTSQDVESSSRNLLAAHLELREVTAEAAAAVSSFCQVTLGHSALTSESSTMIEEVLAISDDAEGAHDVHSLAQEACAGHKDLMTDLTKINHLIFPLEPVLASVATTFIRRVADRGELEADVEVGDQCHNLAAAQSLLKSIRETVLVVANTVPGLIKYIKRLHSSLAKLSRTASLHAGVLHKALEGVGESQEVRSQVIAAVGSELATVGLISPEGQTGGFIDPDAHVGAARLVSQSDGLYLQDHEESFMSHPDISVSLESVHRNEGGMFQLTVEASQSLTGDSCASPSSISKTNAFSGTCSSNQILEGGGAAGTKVEENSCIPTSELRAVTEKYRHSSAGAFNFEKADEDMSMQSGLQKAKGNVYNLVIRDACASTQVTCGSLTDVCRRDQQSHLVSKHTKHESLRARNIYHVMNSDFRHRNTREKNAYAVSVLKGVRTKLEGRDINGTRQLAVAEHVDHLLRQATSIDNLCNMFEGWTPWI